MLKKTNKSGASSTEAANSRRTGIFHLLNVIAFALTLTFCVSWIFFHTYLTDGNLVRACVDEDKNILPEKRQPVILDGMAADGYVWNLLAESLGKNGEWRIRRSDFDNAPNGREVHWSSAFAWYLRALGELYRAVTGESLRNSIFRMSIWANPILLSVSLVVVSILFARRFGLLVGAGVAVGMIVLRGYYYGFYPAYPDHHGLISLWHLLMFYGIASAGAGWVVKNSARKGFCAGPETARKSMVLSGLAGAAGMWTSAISTTLVLCALGVGVLAAAIFFGRGSADCGADDDNKPVLDPSLWRLWGAVGSVGSLAFYLLEYFPFHIGMRLEVNHPLYSLAWLSASWILAEMVAWLSQPGCGKLPLLKLSLLALGCAILPLFVFLGGSKFYLPMDTFLTRVWSFTHELTPLVEQMRRGGVSWANAIGVSPFLLAGVAFVLFDKKTEQAQRVTLTIFAVSFSVMLALYFYQIRWQSLLGTIKISLGCILLGALWKRVSSHRPFIRLTAPLLLFVSFAALAVPAFNRSIRPQLDLHFLSIKQNRPMLGLFEADMLLHRRLARAIIADSADRQPVILASPGASVRLAAFAGAKVTGTFYWENLEGLRAAALMLNSHDERELRQLLDNHGITHVYLSQWGDFSGEYHHCLHGKGLNDPDYKNTFVFQALAFDEYPFYFRPLPVFADELVRGLKTKILILAYDPTMSAGESLYHRAVYDRVFSGNVKVAENKLRKALEYNLNFEPAQKELVLILLMQRRFKEAADLVEAFHPNAKEIQSFKKASVFLSYGDKENAIKALKEVVESREEKIAYYANLFTRFVAGLMRE
jgi:tetratricopeptide (TPR) repeat protein